MFNQKKINIICLILGIVVIIIVGIEIASKINNEKYKANENNQKSTAEFEKQIFNEKEEEKNEIILEKEESKEFNNNTSNSQNHEEKNENDIVNKSNNILNGSSGNSNSANDSSSSSTKKTNDSKDLDNNSNKKPNNSDNNTPNNQVGKNVVDPNNPYFSFHKGKCEYKTRQTCLNDYEKIAFKNVVDIINGTCMEVTDYQGNVMYYYLYIKCSSGNCEKYDKYKSTEC